MTGPSGVSGEIWVPDPADLWSTWPRFGGTYLMILDREAAQAHAERKMSGLTRNDWTMQNYSQAHDRATRLQRANAEIRFNRLLEQTMGDNPFAPHPQAWRGQSASALVRLQEFSAAVQQRWLSGYNVLIDKIEGAWAGQTYTFRPPTPTYDWPSLTRLISSEGDRKYFRDIAYGVDPKVALARARARLHRLAQTVTQDAEQQTMYALMGDNSRVRGWQRLVAPGACPWCCLLSSRGGVYRSYETAKFGRRGLYHLPRDNCTVRPVFRRWEHLPQLTDAAEARVQYATALYGDAVDSVIDGAEPVNPLAAKRLEAGEPKRSVYMDEFLYRAYRDPMFTPRGRFDWQSVFAPAVSPY